MISDQLQQMQLRAFEAALALSSNLLSFNGLEARVIASPRGTSKLFKNAGALTLVSSTVEMKRTDFERMRLQDRSVVRLDGVELQISLTNPDDGDALINFVLAPAAALTVAEQIS